mgnify:FL=1
MKRIVLLLSLILVTSACTNLNNLDYKDNINEVIKSNSNNKLYNHVGNGYKYYLPKYMSVKNMINFNEKINSNDYTYYLYLDVVSFNSKKQDKINKKCDINYEFKQNNNEGFLCVNNVNNEYLVEIVYNYAKIEVKVAKNDLNEAINNGIIILSTIKYDGDLISKMIGESKLDGSEETLNIFKDTKSKDDFLDVVEEYDNYDDSQNKVPDYDVIN